MGSPWLHGQVHVSDSGGGGGAPKKRYSGLRVLEFRVFGFRDEAFGFGQSSGGYPYLQGFPQALMCRPQGI